MINNEKVNSSIVDKFYNNRKEIYLEQPYLYAGFDLVSAIIQTKGTQIPVTTMAVSLNEARKNSFLFYWHGDFISNQTDSTVQGAIMHELLHIAFGHLTTRRPFDPTQKTNNINGKDYPVMELAKLWNIATDMAINQYLRTYLDDKKFIYPEQYNLPPFHNAEFYYEELLKQYKNNPNNMKMDTNTNHDFWNDPQNPDQNPADGSNGDAGECDGEPSDATGNGSPKAGKEDKDAKDGAGSGSEKDDKKDKDGKGAGEKDLKDLNDKVKELADNIRADMNSRTQNPDIAKGKNSEGREPGTGGSNKLRVFNPFVKPKLLPLYIQKMKYRAVNGFDPVISSTRKKPNRRFGYQFPGVKKSYVRKKIIVYVDVSGSIDEELLQIFERHVKAIYKQCDFDIVFFDTSVLNPLIEYKGKKIQHPCGGGTDFEPVIKHWNRMNKKYAAGYIFTDGDASYSTTPLKQKDLNWLVYGNLRNIKHGNKHSMNRSDF